jgi:hypothetical protein
MRPELLPRLGANLLHILMMYLDGKNTYYLIVRKRVILLIVF